MTQHLRLLLLPFLALLLIVSCGPEAENKPFKAVLVDDPAKVNNEIQQLLRKRFAGHSADSTLVIHADSLHSTDWLIQLYASNNHLPFWSDKGNNTRKTDSLLAVLHAVEENGLLPADYHFPMIDSLLKKSHDSISHKFDANILQETDLLLSDAFLTLCVHLHTGRLHPDSLSREWHPEKMDTNMVQLFLSVYKKGNFRACLDSLEPQNPQYQSLKKALQAYRYEFKDSHWDSLKSRESDSTTFNERLKQRLIASHDYFDEYNGSDSIKLVKAIKNLQCRYHLTEDGKVGKLTFKALQMTKEDVIRQIEMNMERWRWKNAPSEKRFVWVNIPKYEMKVMEEDTLVMESRVICGQPDHQTPLLKSTIRYFIIYPYWNVPFSIATKELLPILKRDTSYLRRKNFEVLDGHNNVVDPKKIKWKRFSTTYFPYRIRQRIGDDNSLGILKFNFENKYGVYMHDTDNRKLFNREMRALSHGCVRLEKFMDFASFLIREDSVKYPGDSLNMDLLREKQKYVYIRKPIAVYINYYTAETLENGALQLYIDIYRRDEKMLAALEGKK